MSISEILKDSEYSLKLVQTDMYYLSDIVLPDGTKPHNDANYEKNHIAGKY